MPDSYEFQVTIPSDTSEAQEVQERIIAQLEQYEYAMRDVFSMRLAIEEAIVNAIKHGNKRDVEKKVHVSWSVNAQRVTVAVEDEGAGFKLEEVPDCTAEENLDKPSGRGIMLMRNFLSSIEYNDKGNRVTLVKERDLESDTAATA